MANQRRRLPRELSMVLALGCVVFATMVVLIVGQLQVGVPSCPACTTTGGDVYCNNDDLTYCNGGLPVLAATLSGLSVASIGFGFLATGASRRDWQGEASASGKEAAVLTPVWRRTIGLSLIFDGGAITSLGLWMAVPPLFAICTEPCSLGPYMLTGIPLGLVVAGVMLLIPGVSLLLLSLPPHRGLLAVSPRINRST